MFAKSRRFGSLSLSGSVGARHTILRIELYAKKRLSGLKEASVIVHWPYGYTTDCPKLEVSFLKSTLATNLVVLPVIWIRGVVHPNSKVLCAGEEEVPIV